LISQCPTSPVPYPPCHARLSITECAFTSPMSCTVSEG
jgi:hypothetical protein